MFDKKFQVGKGFNAWQLMQKFPSTDQHSGSANDVHYVLFKRYSHLCHFFNPLHVQVNANVITELFYECSFLCTVLLEIHNEIE